MRPRFALLGSLLAALAAAVVPGTASATPSHNNGLTINATPDPIIAGEGVLIYGQLSGTNIVGQPVALYHRVNPARGYSLVQKATTDSFGFYEFPRVEGLVYTNRSWFVRGPDGARSRTLFERVGALVSIQPSTTNADTSQPILFSGHVTPNHAFERVYLQTQRRATDEWRTLASTRIDRRSNYQMAYRWRFPGERVVRVLFRGDARDVRSASDPVNVTIEQHQVSDFTIDSSSPVLDYGQPATLSGTLHVKGTHRPEPNTPVTLCGRPLGASQFSCDTAGVTDNDGTYRFTVRPTNNEAYMVKTTLPPNRHTARALEGVRDAVTLASSSPSAWAGQKVTFSGSVTPDKAGDTVYLQRFGADGDWHTVGVTKVRFDGAFQFVRVFGTPGDKVFRARVLADPQNIGGISATTTIHVALPPVTLLPQQQ